MRGTPAFRAAFADEFPGLRESLAGQFEVERELGRGGMGVVYLAREVTLDRLVALKVLPPMLARIPETRERFLREARTAARLAHPNVVPVYRADEAAGTAYFAMAFIDGESLAERVRDRGPLPPSEAVPILRAVAWALAYAHARNVVHRDVKPDNILLERVSGRTLVTDFGIAHHSAITDEGARLTRDGHILGTLHYMSPEQVSGEPLDGRSDLYSLGAVAYYVLSGRVPFEDLGGPAVLVAHATRPAPPLLHVAPTVLPSLAAVVDRCLAKRPDERYATGEALADALERALAEAPAEVRVTTPSLPSGLPERVDEAQAAAIWRRAAQLQADAVDRIEFGGRLVDRAALGGTAPEATDRAATSRDVGASYRITDVVGAAEEAGISRQYVAMALAELPRGTLPSDATTTRRAVDDRMAVSMLGTDVRSLGVTVAVPTQPANALRALGIVLQQAPYQLQLRETVGAHPLDGGVIVFDLPGPVAGAAGAPAGSINRFWMATHQQLEAHQVQVTLRASASAGAGSRDQTEVTMTADLRPGLRRNIRTSAWLAGILGGTTGVVVGASAAKTAAVLSVAVLSPAIGVGACVAALSLLGYRRLYPNALAKAEQEMQQSLHAVAAAVQSEAVFGTRVGSVESSRGALVHASDESTYLSG